MLSDLIGQKYAAQVLRGAIRDGRVTGSFLLVGPDSVGKTMAAREFAKAILCDNPGPGPDCCDRCANCRAVNELRHPDVRSAAPTGPSRILRIPQIWPRDGVRDFPPENALLHDLSFAPIQGARRVFILEQADALNDDTANSLLKVLEEPPPYATFILTAPSTSAVVPTIFSRCHTVRFRAVSEAMIEEELIRRDLASHAEARFIASLSQGRIGAAFRMAGDEQFGMVRDTILRTASQLCTAPEPIVALKYADDLRKIAAKLTPAKKDGADGAAELGARQAAVAALEMLALWYRDLLTIAATNGTGRLINGDHAEALRASAAGYTQTQLGFGLDLILDIRRCVERNANAQIAFEALALRLAMLRSSSLPDSYVQV